MTTLMIFIIMTKTHDCTKGLSLQWKRNKSPKIKHPNRAISSHWSKHISSSTSTAECFIIHLQGTYTVIIISIIPLTPDLGLYVLNATCVSYAYKVHVQAWILYHIPTKYMYMHRHEYYMYIIHLQSTCTVYQVSYSGDTRPTCNYP